MIKEKATIFKKMEYYVTSQSKWTFNIPPVRKFISNYLNCDNKTLNLFAGENLLNTPLFNNVIDNKDEEALEFISKFKDNTFDLVILDPPYASHYEKLYKCPKIKNYGEWLYAVRKEAARVVKLGGIVITIGYDTNGIGAIKGFEKEILFVLAHGGLLRDTFIYSERKVQNGKHYNTWRDK